MKQYILHIWLYSSHKYWLILLRKKLVGMGVVLLNFL